MINEAQLKVCRMCKHRNLTVARGMVCKLTDDISNFENQCPTFEYDESRPEASYGATSSKSNGSNTPVWRILLSIAIIVFSIVRISNSCSKRKEAEQNNLLEMNQFEQTESQMPTQEEMQEADQMSLISAEDAKELGIIQTTKDSIVKIDKGFSVTIPNEYYSLSNLNDDKTVVLFLRSTQNESVVIYKMKTSIEKLQEDWKKIRENNTKDLIDSNVNTYAINDDMFKYKVQNKVMTINGKAKIIKTNNVFYLVQFESATKNVENVFVRADYFFDSYINN